jgi:hypothetical protein
MTDKGLPLIFLGRAMRIDIVDMGEVGLKSVWEQSVYLTSLMRNLIYSSSLSVIMSST